jgi:2,3-bisphosphoglycerate-independent phosphoglycerate mutase
VVAVLVILDGASEPLRGGEATSLELAATPALDALAAAGTVVPLANVPAGLPAGSESAIPALLGWTPTAPVDRAAIEAAAHGIALARGERAWRVDVLDGGGARAGARAVARAAAELRALAPHHRVHDLAGHRLLLTGPPPFPAEGAHPDAPTASPGERLQVWPEGIVPPPTLDASTVVVGARGAAIGVARLMGAATVVPAGATGDVDSDLGAKASAALEAVARGAERVVVHVGAPDEAAHRRDRTAKVAAIERADRELIAPLAAAAARGGGSLRVCPDHGCDPRTGLHDDAPVPCLDWRPGAVSAGGDRLTERTLLALAEAA